MQYLGTVIQQLWTDEPVRRSRSGRRRRTREVPGAVRRQRSDRRTRLD